MEKIEQKNPSSDKPIIKSPESKKRSDKMYDINEIENGFEIILPALISLEHEGMTVGIRRQIVGTKEEAEQVIADDKKSEKIFFEKTSLEKTYSQHGLRIKETKDGKFNISIPISVEQENGAMFITGGGHKSFDSWDEAKKYFLQELKNREKITHKPILEIQTSENEKIAFSQIDDFNPRVAPSNEVYEIPQFVDRKGLNGTDKSAMTYQQTIKEKGWDKNLFFFIKSYLQNKGAEIMRNLKIKHLDALTPKQAIELSTQIVIDLTKYKFSDTLDPNINPLDMNLNNLPGESSSDKSTVQQLLQNGLINKDDPNWEGNGVCRNFASAVKAVFEALKLNQTKFNLLGNTYALFEGGDVAQEIEDPNVTSHKINPGHAWNTFLTISKEGSANAVIVDATWAQRDLESKEIKGLDHTLTRMEPMVNRAGKALDKNSSDHENQLSHILSFYAIRVESPTQIFVPSPPVSSLSEEEKTYLKNIVIKAYGKEYNLSKLNEDQFIDIGMKIKIEMIKNSESKIEKRYSVSRAVELMRLQGVPKNIPKSLIEAVDSEYLELAEKTDPSEIETIYKIYENNLEMNFHAILKKYFKTKSLSNYQVGQTIFKNDNLQKLVFEELKSREDFDKFFKSSPKFRIRMREVLPQLFIDFSPTTKPEDSLELSQLIHDSNKLRDLYSDRYFKNLSEEKLNSFFDKIRSELMKLNPKKYNEIVSGLDNYQLIKQYDKLCGQLKN